MENPKFPVMCHCAKSTTRSSLPPVTGIRNTPWSRPKRRKYIYRLSREKEGNSRSPLTGSLDHCCVLKSKRGRPGRESLKKATTYRPSGDQRGDHMFDEPGTTVTCPLLTSRMRRSP